MNDDSMASSPTFGRATHTAISFIAIVVAVALAGVIVLRLRVLVVSAVLALMVAAALDPLAEWFRQHGVRRGWFAAISLTVVLSGSTAIAFWMVPQLWATGGSLAPELSKLWTQIQDWLANGPLKLSLADLRSLGDRLGIFGSGTGSSLLKGLASSAVTIAELIEGAALTLVFTIYFLLRGDRYAAWAVGSAPENHRTSGEAVSLAVWGDIGAYTRAIVVNGAINATMLGVALWLLGVPAALQLALIAFIAGFFPVVGTIGAGLLSALVALASNGLLVAILVVLVTAVVHHLELYVIGPQVVGRWARLHPVAVITVVAAGASLAGIVGVFLGPPILVVATAVIRTLRGEGALS